MWLPCLASYVHACDTYVFVCMCATLMCTFELLSPLHHQVVLFTMRFCSLLSNCALCYLYLHCPSSSSSSSVRHCWLKAAWLMIWIKLPPCVLCNFRAGSLTSLVLEDLKLNDLSIKSSLIFLHLLFLTLILDFLLLSHFRKTWIVLEQFSLKSRWRLCLPYLWHNWKVCWFTFKKSLRCSHLKLTWNILKQ